MYNKELDFILDVLREEPLLNEDNYDWFWILGFLELNKISGYFFNKVKELQIKIPQAVERKLSQILLFQKNRNDYMRKYICDIGDELRFEKIKYAFLKGSVLSNANFNFSENIFHCMSLSKNEIRNYRRQSEMLFYGQGERISTDIDILTEQINITIISDILRRMGFVQGYYDYKNNEVVPLSRNEIVSRRMNRGETAPFILKTEDTCVPFIEVDLNFSLDYLPNSNKELLSAVLQETVDYSGSIVGGIRSLKIEDFFLQLIMHQYKESILYSMVERNKDVELYKLLDIYLFIKKGYIELNQLYGKIKRFRLEKAVVCVLEQLFQVFQDNCFKDYVCMFSAEGVNAEEVIDPILNKKYIRDRPLRDRLMYFNKKEMLKEVQSE